VPVLVALLVSDADRDRYGTSIAPQSTADSTRQLLPPLHASQKKMKKRQEAPALVLVRFHRLVQRSFIVAVVNLFIVAFFVTASARGQ
jgi:hypothetical protein